MTIPPDQLTALGALAARATPGPWRLSERLSGSENHRGWDVYGSWFIGNVSPMCDPEGRGDPSDEGRANAELIAAANPAVVAALVAEVLGLRAGMAAFDEFVTPLAQTYAWVGSAIEEINAAIADAGKETTP